MRDYPSCLEAFVIVCYTLSMSEDTGKIKWHQGFYGGLELELAPYRDGLQFEQEHQLGKEPSRIDILIIKKDESLKIPKGVGAIFRKYNIVEYKSPEDSLTIDGFYKTLGYAFLYKGLGKTVDAVPAGELTVSMFCDAYPRELFSKLEGQGLKTKEVHPGIFYVSGMASIPIQVVVSGRPGFDSVVLKALSTKAQKEDIQTLTFLKIYPCNRSICHF